MKSHQVSVSFVAANALKVYGTLKLVLERMTVGKLFIFNETFASNKRDVMQMSSKFLNESNKSHNVGWNDTHKYDLFEKLIFYSTNTSIHHIRQINNEKMAYWTPHFGNK